MYPAHALDLLQSRLVLRAALASNIIHKEATMSFSSTLKQFQGKLGGKINNILSYVWPHRHKNLI